MPRRPRKETSVSAVWTPANKPGPEVTILLVQWREAWKAPGIPLDPVISEMAFREPAPAKMLILPHDGQASEAMTRP